MAGERSTYDCVVIGGGVAGMSAAMVLGRARRRTLVVDKGEQSNRAAAHVGGGLILDGTEPEELYRRGREQLGAYEAIELREDEAVDARALGRGDFAVTLRSGAEVRSRTLVLATGLVYEVPDVPGFAELWGGAVFHCPFCHGWDVRDRPLAVYGEGEMARKQAKLLAGWTDQVTVVGPDQLEALRIEDGRLLGLTLRDGTEVACEAVLLHAALRRPDRLAEQLGLELTETDFVQIDEHAHTSVPGVYAAGDLAVAPQQVAIALGSGHLAGLIATRELLLA